MRKKYKYVCGFVVGIGFCLFTKVPALASDNTVMDMNLVLYSNSETALYESADPNSKIVLSKEEFPDNAPVQVTGITSNGFYRIELNNVTYYVEGTCLQNNVTSVQSEPSNATDRVTVDLGYGVTFDSPKYVDEYYLDIYKGKIEIVDAKITKKNADSMPDVFGLGTLSLKYKPSEYGNYNGRNMYVSARAVFLDKDGFEIGDSLFGVNQSSDPINTEITGTMIIPKNTATITVQAD